MYDLKSGEFVNWCLTPTLAVFQLYSGVLKSVYNTARNNIIQCIIGSLVYD
jgi:hypothetical protein